MILIMIVTITIGIMTILKTIIITIIIKYRTRSSTPTTKNTELFLTL